MRDEGSFKLWRRFFDHPYWTEARVFSRAEAWVDVIAMASFRDREAMVGATRVKLARGEFMASIRFLGVRWSWGRHKVHDFIQDAIGHGELRKQGSTEKGDTYLVVNYGHYQAGGDSKGTVRGQRRSKEVTDVSSTDVLDVEQENGSRGKDTWLTPFGRIWQTATGGEPNWGAMAKSLRNPVKKHGEAIVLQAWKACVDRTDPQYLSFPSFSQRIGYWIKESKPRFSGYS